MVSLVTCKVLSQLAETSPSFTLHPRFDSSESLARTPERLESGHWICALLHRLAVLPDDVVKVFRLVRHMGKAGILTGAMDSSRIGTALVDGDLLRQAMQVDGSVQKAQCCCLVSPGCQKKVDRGANLGHCTIRVCSLTRNLGTGLVDSPPHSDRALASAKDKGQNQQESQWPAIHGRVVNKDAALVHLLFNMAQTQPISCAR